MNDEYKRMREDADELWHRFEDRLDDRDAGQGLWDETKNIREMFEMNKNPHSIEDQIKRFIEELRNLRRTENSVMDPAHIDEFIDDYEKLREHVRGLSNY